MKHLLLMALLAAGCGKHIAVAGAGCPEPAWRNRPYFVDGTGLRDVLYCTGTGLVLGEVISMGRQGVTPIEVYFGDKTLLARYENLEAGKAALVKRLRESGEISGRIIPVRANEGDLP